jgi:histidyl-tRNA synthetase
MANRFESPKGTRDFPPGSMAVREQVMRRVENAFRLYGFKKWDGPAFEYLETLTAKSSPEIVKEIYAFKDKGDRDLGLRFELTTSLARLMAANPRLPRPVKAWSSGKVWRYENTQKGRYREFLQMDADVFGSASPLVESELLLMASAVLSSVGFRDCVVLLNDRRILDGLTASAGIPEGKKLDAFRALDKLAKIGPDGVAAEFERRGLSAESFRSVMAVMESVRKSSEPLEEAGRALASNPTALEGVAALRTILDSVAKASGSLTVSFDPTLIRGFDYYTGPVYEIRMKGSEDMGSISGGGRYDNLVELFGGEAMPAAGISFGIERIMDIIESDMEKRSSFGSSASLVCVVSFGPETAGEALRLTERFRTSGISAETDLSGRAFKKQMQAAGERGYAWALVVGEEELKSGTFNLKKMADGSQIRVSLDEAIGLVKKEAGF